MFQFITIALFIASSVYCQDERALSGAPTRYVLPYAGLGDEQADEQYYKPNRRSERIPATSYQYDEALADEEYYRPQPRPKAGTDNYPYQTPSSSSSSPSHKDYEQILKMTHLARLRASQKKQSQPQLQPQPQIQPSIQAQTSVEQYLKETANLKQEQSEEPQRAVLKQPSYRYVLQPEPQQQQQQKTYQYQYEQEQEQYNPQPPKPPTRFNLVAFQNALLAQQKVLAESEGQDDSSVSKSQSYSSTTTPKKVKKPKTTRPPAAPQYEYYQPQARVQAQAYQQQPETVRYQQPLSTRTLYQKSEIAYDDPALAYNPEKEYEYQTPTPPTRPPKPSPKPRVPTRKPKYQTEEQPEEYTQEKEQDQYEYRPVPVKYQPEEPTINYRRPLTRQPPKTLKYQQQQPTEEQSEALAYQRIPKYQQEPLPRRPQYQQEELRALPPRFRQYQEETQLLPQYQPADLAYQPSSITPVTYQLVAIKPFNNPHVRFVTADVNNKGCCPAPQ